MNFENQNGLLLESFQLSTFCSYLKNGETKGFSLLATVEQLIDSFDPEYVYGNYEPLSEQQINQIIIDNNLASDINVTLTSGFTTISDLLNDINTGYTQYLNNNFDSVNEILINVKDASGNTVTPISLNEAINDFKNSIGSSVLERAAIESSDQNSISDRIAKFNAIAENSIDINSEIFTNSVNYYKSMLVNNLSGIDIINKVFSDCGVASLSQGNPVIIKDYPIAKYSGCSPLGSLSMNTYHQVLRTTGEVIGNVCGAIVKGFAKVGKWIWGKAKKYTTEALVNPYDITDNGNTDTTYSFSGFQYQATNVHTGGFFLSDPSYTQSAEIQLLKDLLNLNADNWYFMQTIGGEMAVKFRDVDFNWNDTDWIIYADIDVVFKPYSLAEIHSSSYDSEVGMTSEELLNYMNSQTGDRYLTTSSPEHTLLNSFINGIAVHWGILSTYCEESRGNIGKVFPNKFIHFSQGDVTNKDVFETATGYKMEGYDLCRYLVNPIRAYNPSIDEYAACYDIAQMGLLLLILIANLKYHNNILNNNVVYYVPYMKEDFTISEGRFGIKTDEQNQDIAEAIFSAIIIIAIATLVIVTGKIIVNTISKNLFWKRKQFVSKCDAALWSGEKLSDSDKRRYIRYQKKLQASHLVSEGLSRQHEDGVTGLFSALYDNITGDYGHMSLSKLYDVIV